jgi:hypothetical protein
MNNVAGLQNDAYMRMYEKYGRQDKHVNAWDDSRPVRLKTEQERERAFRPFASSVPVRRPYTLKWSVTLTWHQVLRKDQYKLNGYSN